MADDRINNEQLKRIAFKDEQRFLSIILKDKESLMETVAMGVKPGPDGHFWSNESRFLYNIIHSYYKKYNNILTRTAMESVMSTINTVDGKNISSEDKAAAQIYWDKIFHVDVPISDFKMLLEGINNRFVQWQAVKVVQSKMEDLMRMTSNQGELVKNLKAEINNIDGLFADPYSLTMDFATGMDKSLEHIVSKREGLIKNDGAYCGIKALDDIHCGFDDGSYNVIMGMVNGGKTTMMFNLAFNMAKMGHYVIYVSLEKKAVPFYMRLLCLHSMVDYNRLRRGGKGPKGIDDKTFEALKIAIRELKEKISPSLTCVQMNQGTKISKILAEVDRIKNDINTKDPGFRDRGKKIIFFLDYIGATGNETTTVGRADLDDWKTSQRVQAFGRENNFVTFTATQLKATASKDIRNKAKKATADDPSNVEITTEDGSGSKMILADADTGMGLVLNSEVPPNKMFVCITKARDSESRRTIVIDFDGKLGRVSDPILEPGQVKDLNDILYNKDLTEEKLKSEDGLFDPSVLNREEDVLDPEPQNKIPREVDDFVKEFADGFSDIAKKKDNILINQKSSKNYDDDDLFDAN